MNLQVIRFGENILDLVQEARGEDIATVLIPLGAMDEETETRLTVASVNEGKDYIAIGKVSEDSGLDVNMASHFRKTATFDDVVNVGGLLNVTGLVAGFARPFFGTCNTTASTSVKTVTCEGFDRKVGAVIRILMTNTNTASLPQLNINSTGAAYLSYGNARAASGSTQWLAGSILTVVYTGSYYEVLSMAGSWTPTIAGAASYTYQEGYFEYHAGVVSFGFSINGTFSSSTTSTTQTVVAGLPFTNAGMGLATGGGIAYLTLDPTRCAHSITLKHLGRNKSGTAPFGKPLPCVFVNVSGAKLCAILLSGREKRRRLWHDLAFQVSSAVFEINDSQLAFPRIAFRNFLRNRFLRPSSRTRFWTPLPHAYHLISGRGLFP